MKSLYVLVVLALLIPCLRAEDALKFTGVDGEDYTPLALNGKKAAVLFFVSPFCPTSNNFMPEINQIAADYAEGFAFYIVEAEPDLQLTDILRHVELFTIKSPVLLDPEMKLAKQTGATITPESVVVGADGKVLYQGRVNDLYLTATRKQRQGQPTTKELRDALDAIQAGTPIANAKVPAVGCKISGLK